ncbi:MAG: calcium-binding protein [Actinomycetota bacterium]
MQVIHLTDGDDTASYGAGQQCVDANRGADTVHLGGDIDVGVGEEGADLLVGDGGKDELYGLQGGDTLRGEDHADFMIGSLGRDTMIGGPGDDFIADGPGVDYLRGNAGDDELFHCHGNGFQDDDIAGFETHSHVPEGTVWCEAT